MTAYGIIGDVEASPKLVRAALSDLIEAHRRLTPSDVFWLMVGVRNGDTKVHDEILDWAHRNEVYFEVVTPAATYEPFIAPAKLTVSASFMLDVVEAMRHEDGGKILALVGDQMPKTDVLRALARAKDNGTEIRDLAEAGLTLILFKGDDPPPEDSEEETIMSTETEVEATLAELGEYADDVSDEETAAQAQEILTEAAHEAGIDPDEYPTWAEVAALLQEAKDAAEGAAPAEPEDEPEPAIEGLTREALVGKEIAEIKALAKAAGIEGYSKMRREPLIKALLGEETEVAAVAAPTKAPAGEPSSNGTLSDDDVERIAEAVVSKLAAALSTA